MRGSLVVNAAANAVTFIKTGGGLAADTYTVTLRSGDANAFVDSLGGDLDGNANGGTASYSTTFTVATNPSAVTLSLPSFVRGPGQTVNVPVTGTGIPIHLSDGTGVTSVDITITYDPTMLTITGASLGSSVPSGWTFTPNVATPGRGCV